MTKDTEALREALGDQRSWLCDDIWLSIPAYMRKSIQKAHDAALATPASDVADPDFREYVRKAGERLAPHSGDAPGTPTRDALVWINAALHPVARASVPLDCPIAPNAPASDVAPVEYETLIAAGFDEYAAHCALRTDGGFCHAYFYSDGQWRFQTGGNDLTLADWTLTKRLFAHPPLAQSVDPVADEEALREALEHIHNLPGELNLANYNEDDVRELNENFIDAILTAEKALAALKGPASRMADQPKQDAIVSQRTRDLTQAAIRNLKGQTS